MLMKKLFTFMCLATCATQALCAQEALPFIEAFDDELSMDRFTVVDNNKDGLTWTYDADLKLARYDRSEVNAGDDWMFTPAFTFEQGHRYKVSFTTQGKYISMTERMSVTVGRDLEPASHTKVVGTVEVMWNSEFRLTEYEFTVDETATYHVGFHEISDAYTYYLLLDDIRIEEVSDETAPGPVQQLTATPGADGALQADISFVTPKVDATGAPLASLDGVEIYRSGLDNPIKLIDVHEMGGVCKFSDVVPASGEYSYKVMARNKGGLSEAATCEVYVGNDSPKAVENLQVSIVAGNPALRWEMPQRGAHGGYVDVDAITFTVMRNSIAGDGTVEDVVVSQGKRDLAFVDNGINFDYMPQVLVRYTVWAVNNSVDGVKNISRYVVAGEPYPAPMTEDFAMCSTIYYPWYSEKTGTDEEKYWDIKYYGTSPAAYSDDMGVMMFRSVNADMGESERFYSPVFDVSGLLHPAVLLKVYHTTGASDQDCLQIEASGNGSEWKEAGEAIVVGGAAVGDWQDHVVSLDEFAGCDSLVFAMKGISAQGSNIIVDNVSLIDNCYDMGITQVAADGSADPDKDFTITVAVENCGAKLIDSYKVELSRDGGESQQAASEAALAPGETATVAFTCRVPIETAGSDVVYTARIVCEQDEKPANDVQETTIEIYKPVFPVVQGLTASADDRGVHLTWQPAEAYKNYPVITEDFEAYEPFIIDNIGLWTVVDGDGADTGISSNTTGYAHRGEPMAFQVFNPVEAGIDMESYQETWGTYKGEQYLLGIFNEDDMTPNDDWLISPEVEAGSYVSLYAKSVTAGYRLAEMEILYSTESVEPESFELLQSVTVPASSWTHYEFRLPEGASYFAIHHITQGGLGLMLDEIVYKPLAGSPVEEQATGYNVYRNGECITDEPVTVASFDDTVAEAGNYSYTVTAVYASGESYFSDPATVDVSASVGTVEYDGCTISGGDGVIEVSATCAGQLGIYATDGTMRVNKWMTDGHEAFSMPAGIYIVRFGNCVRKIVVR